MIERQTTGRAGEAVALEYLQRKGLRLMARNLHLGHDEIDLIMECERFCHIIEVKTLTSNSFQMPFDKVDRAKRMNLVKAARRYVHLQQIQKEIVFDIVSILISGSRIFVQYLPCAFTVDEVQ